MAQAMGPLTDVMQARLRTAERALDDALSEFRQRRIAFRHATRAMERDARRELRLAQTRARKTMERAWRDWQRAVRKLEPALER